MLAKKNIYTKNDILNYLKVNKSNIQKSYCVDKLGLFGSFSKNTNHFSSDIDLIIRFDENYIKTCDPWDYFDKLNAIKKDISNHFLLNVDIVDEQSSSPYLTNIQKEAIYV